MRPVALRIARRTFATAVHPHPVASSSSAASAIPLSNVEAQWEKLASDEQLAVHQQLEELQKKDWKTLSLAEKKAAYYVAFGPHGPRTPINPPGTSTKVILGVLGLIGAAGATYAGMRSLAAPPPKTLTREWEEAANERAKELKLNPITGVSSEGYTGKGFVQSK
ncbi:cytochrome c oxidase subunit IV [Auriscalpium vulgare]|uniref:Cytochrome c oxidase subunit IV n=1 Tax=Auriscalpium vulgare TaxID=40419 RepID=A0ACB8RUA1_9AGAM|nr:cytochrome c oxidase subunit IV [Auriscalpium vulgare]